MIGSQSVNQIYETLRMAGEKITDIEKSGNLAIEYKSDQSPLTRADKASSIFICSSLKNILPGIPVLSEEDKQLTEGSSDRFWLLDPLDGTKEFIKGNGEYCISLALISKGRPIEAYIYWPTQQILWYAFRGEGAYSLKNGETEKLPLENKAKEKPLILLRSRSHHKPAEVAWHKKASLNKQIEIEQQGSAIKFCMIAEGKADFYIKKGRIFGWDIAAGELILSESGGRLVAFGANKDISYGFNSSEMPHFLACSNRIENPEDWLF